jgi:hypothetical protein
MRVDDMSLDDMDAVMNHCSCKHWRKIMWNQVMRYRCHRTSMRMAMKYDCQFFSKKTTPGAAFPEVFGESMSEA